MGIRFYCPNGHKLNVKQFQAGRQGVCPVCGVSMQIPLESTRPSSSKKGRRKEAPQDSVVLSQSSAPATTPEDAAAPIRSPGPASGSDTPAAAGAPSANQPPSSTPATTLGSPAATDPLSEAGDAVWFVRPPSGGQYGPATGPVMRSWLAEGRISADALVWREGWRDWQEAVAVFRELSPALTVPLLDKAARQPVVAVKPTPEAGHSRRPPGRLSKRSKQTVAIGWLIAAVIVLSVIFFWILLKQ